MSAIWDAWSNHYPAPQATAGEAKQNGGEETAPQPPQGASLANAWGNLYAAAHEVSVAEVEQEVAGPSIFDLWKGAPPVEETGEVTQAEVPHKQGRSSLHSVWDDLYDSRRTTLLRGEGDESARPLPSYGSGMQHIWDDLAAARKVELHADEVVAERPRAGAMGEAGAADEFAIDAGALGQDLIINSRQSPSAFLEWRELMQAGHPHAALAPAESYSYRMARSGFVPQEMSRRMELIAKLQGLLKGMPREPAAYRQVVPHFLARCAPELHDTALICARDYYYFWLGDLRMRPGRYAGCEVAIRKLEAFESSQFKTLLKRMERGPCPPEPPSLGIYRGHLFEHGVQGRELAARELLLSALLFLLDRRPFLAGSYRWGVDALLMHIAQPAERDSVLTLVRDFFYYWIAYPPAGIRNEIFD
jgi:hypothetical protein